MNFNNIEQKFQDTRPEYAQVLPALFVSRTLYTDITLSGASCRISCSCYTLCPEMDVCCDTVTVLDPRAVTTFCHSRKRLETGTCGIDWFIREGAPPTQNIYFIPIIIIIIIIRQRDLALASPVFPLC